MSTIWNSRTTMALGTLTTVIACTGSDPNDTPKRDADPDVSPPEIVSQMPLHRDPEVSVHQPIEVKFSERVRLSDSVPVTLFANTGESDVPVPATVRLSPDATVVTIEPNAPLSAPAAYSVKLGDIRDEAGNAFVSMEWRWNAPRWLRVGQPLEDAGEISRSMIVAGPGEQVTVGSTVTVNPSTQRLLLHTIEHSKDKWAMVDNRLTIDSRIPPSLLLDKELGLSALISDRENHIVLDQWLDMKWQEHSLDTLPIFDGALVTKAKNGERFLAYTGDVPDGDFARDIFVSHGSNWSQLGGSVNGDDGNALTLISLSLDRQGTPYVAYSTSSDAGRLRYWSHDSWALLAPSTTAPGDGTTILQMTVDDGGTPFALVNLYNGPPEASEPLQIRRFDGDRWIDCGARLVMSDSPVLGYFGPALDGHIFAAVIGRNTHAEVPDKFLTFDVTRDGWTAIPPPVETLPWQSTTVSGTVDPSGAPILAWNEGSVVHLRRLNR